FTQPPHPYNPSSLLKKMEDANIGTKATRAGIIDLLYARGYIREERMRASELANKVTDTLSTYCPLIIDSSFTANLENLMQDIQNGLASRRGVQDRKSTRLNSSHVSISYAVFCLKKKKQGEIALLQTAEFTATLPQSTIA